MLLKKWTENLAPKIERGVAAELQRAERASIVNRLPMGPRTHDQENFIIGGVLRFDGFLNRDRAVDVLLIPEAVHEHHRDFERFFGQGFIYRLFAPVKVVGRMFDDLFPKTKLFEPSFTADEPSRAALHKRVELIKIRRPPFFI